MLSWVKAKPWYQRRSRRVAPAPASDAAPSTPRPETSSLDSRAVDALSGSRLASLIDTLVSTHASVQFIVRKSGSAVKVNQLWARLAAATETTTFDWATESPHALIGVLKRLLRTGSTATVPLTVYEALQSAAADPTTRQPAAVVSALRALTEPQLAQLRQIFKLLTAVASTPANLMSSTAVGAAIGPSVLCPSLVGTATSAADLKMVVPGIMSYLIDNATAFGLDEVATPGPVVRHTFYTAAGRRSTWL